MQVLIVYDSEHPGARQNICFQDEYANQGTGHTFTVELAKRAIRKGYQIVTADVFLKQQYPADTLAFCITDMSTRNTNALLKRGVIPFLCFSTESPIIARDFYINIKRKAGKFLYNMQFKGATERLSGTPTQSSFMYYPIDARIPLPYSSWDKKKFLILVNRNKRMFFSNYSSFEGVLRSVMSPIKIAFQKMIDPWMRSREIYKDRIEAIYYFSKRNDFYLYGFGWENKIPGFGPQYHTAAIKAFRGPLRFEEKLPVMSQFKFAICFENCIFPGYVTEKIFDCFLAGCIPVYFGAPDIEDFIPRDAFIDFRQFANFEDLERYLITLSENDAMKMLESARMFMASEDFDKYYLENILHGILNKIDNYQAKLNSIKN